MKNYDIIEGKSLNELMNNVSESIDSGFIPIGGIVLIDNELGFIYKQTMFKPKVKIERFDV